MAGQRIRVRSRATRSYQKRIGTIWWKYLGGQLTGWAFLAAAAYGAPEMSNKEQNDEKRGEKKAG